MTSQTFGHILYRVHHARRLLSATYLCRLSQVQVVRFGRSCCLLMSELLFHLEDPGGVSINDA